MEGATILAGAVPDLGVTLLPGQPLVDHQKLSVLWDWRQDQLAKGLCQVDELLMAFQSHPFIKGGKDTSHLAVTDALQSGNGL